MSVTISGTNNTEKWRKEFQEALLTALERVGSEAEGNAKDRITANKSVDTGLLRNSITYAVSGGNAGTSKYRADKPKADGTYATGEYKGTAPDERDKAVYIGTNVEYAPYVELGARGRAGKPFLKPAATEFADDYKRIMQEELQNA